MTNFLVRAGALITYVAIRSHLDGNREPGANNRENEGDHILDNDNGQEETKQD